jgi:hypothetical protein
MVLISILFDASKTSIPTILPSLVVSRLTPAALSMPPSGDWSPRPRYKASRFLTVRRRSAKRPFRVLPQMCVKPRKSNVSGFRNPLRSRFEAAKRPNSISRVFSGCSSSPTSAKRSLRCLRSPEGDAILAPDRVDGDRHQTLGTCLRNHQSLEGVFVKAGEVPRLDDMRIIDRQQGSAGGKTLIVES